MIFKLSHCENPYEVIANYIGNHSEVIEDMIAVLEIDGVRKNELLEYEYDNDSFMFLNDWWEGESEISLIDYYPVRQACNSKTSVPMEVLNKINELVSEGYTVCFKFHPGDYIGIEVTYDREYHANYRLAHLDDNKPDHLSDCIVVILDDLRHKIEYLKGYLEKEQEEHHETV